MTEPQLEYAVTAHPAQRRAKHRCIINGVLTLLLALNSSADFVLLTYLAIVHHYEIYYLHNVSGFVRLVGVAFIFTYSILAIIGAHKFNASNRRWVASIRWLTWTTLALVLAEIAWHIRGIIVYSPNPDYFLRPYIIAYYILLISTLLMNALVLRSSYTLLAD